MASIYADVSDALGLLNSHSLRSTLSNVIPQMLTFGVIFLSAIFLHDVLVKSKQLNVAWWSLILPWFGGRNRSPASPPGPWWNLPVLGYLPWLGAKPYATLWNLSRRFGNVYQIQFGSRKVVVLNGRQAIREAFVHQRDAFAGRPDLASFAAFCEGHSLAFNSFDAKWAAQRKVAMRVLGLFTSNSKYPIKALIHRHAVTLADRLIRDSSPIGHERRAPVAVDPFDAIESGVVAILFEICFGAETDDDKQLYSEMMFMLHEMRAVMRAVQSVDVMPRLAPFFGRPLRRYNHSLQRIHQLTTDKIEAVVDAGVPDTPTCVVHALHRACSTELGGDDVDGSQRARMMAFVQDIIGAGSEVMVNLVHWAILYVAKFPGVQRRVRDEIRSSIGWTASPAAADRARMPYTEACMWEIMRHSCLSAMSMPHAATQDAVVAGCRVAAGTMVFANFYSIGWDPDVWGDPAVFRPQRFLTPDGSRVDREAVDQLMSFGAGRRRCPGAQLGRMETFLFFVVLMQRCVFSAAPGHELPTDGEYLLTNKAKTYHVCVQSTDSNNNFP